MEHGERCFTTREEATEWLRKREFTYLRHGWRGPLSCILVELYATADTLAAMSDRHDGAPVTVRTSPLPKVELHKMESRGRWDNRYRITIDGFEAGRAQHEGAGRNSHWEFWTLDNHKISGTPGKCAKLDQVPGHILANIHAFPHGAEVDKRRQEVADERAGEAAEYARQQRIQARRWETQPKLADALSAALNALDAMQEGGQAPSADFLATCRALIHESTRQD